MKIDVILGLQWGDEGKGKIVDVLSPGYQVIARFQGGPNAGHTLEFGGRKYILHTIPSGIFRDDIINLIGSGVIIDPYIFAGEIRKLHEAGYTPEKGLLISRRTHLILPSHRLLDAVQESMKGDLKIGSTLKGIGPAYTEKVARSGLRCADLGGDDFRARFDRVREQHLRWASCMGVDPESIQIEGMGYAEYEKKWLGSLDLLKSMQFVDGEYFINEALDQGKRVLAEGAQGTLLDVDFGSYPFVTSSNTIAAAVCSGLGVSPRRIDKIFGVFKAYCTRVGSGPFPTELFDEQGEELRKAGHEFGSTTGRPRRCGWLDLPALSYAIMINGVTDLIITKADVLNGMNSFEVCEAYESTLGISSRFSTETVADARPVLSTLKGWDGPLGETWEGLPQTLKDYVDYIAEKTGTPVSIVSTGPDREQTIFLTD